MTLRRLNHLQFRGCLARVVFANQVPVEQKETAIIFSFSFNIFNGADLEVSDT